MWYYTLKRAYLGFFSLSKQQKIEFFNGYPHGAVLFTTGLFWLGCTYTFNFREVLIRKYVIPLSRRELNELPIKCAVGFLIHSEIRYSDFVTIYCTEAISYTPTISGNSDHRPNWHKMADFFSAKNCSHADESRAKLLMANTLWQLDWREWLAYGPFVRP